MPTFRIFQSGERTSTAWKVVPGSEKWPGSFTDTADGRYLPTSFATPDEAKAHCEDLLASDKSLVLYLVDETETIIDTVLHLPFQIEKSRDDDRKFAAKCWVGVTGSSLSRTNLPLPPSNSNPSNLKRCSSEGTA